MRTYKKGPRRGQRQRATTQTDYPHSTRDSRKTQARKPSIADIKAAMDPLSFYSDRLGEFRKRGRYLLAKCLFHPDSRPSFSVNIESGDARCWACGWYGDAIDFCMEHDGVSLAVALNMLAREVGL